MSNLGFCFKLIKIINVNDQAIMKQWIKITKFEYQIPFLVVDIEIISFGFNFLLLVISIVNNLFTNMIVEFQESGNE